MRLRDSQLSRGAAGAIVALAALAVATTATAAWSSSAAGLAGTRATAVGSGNPPSLSTSGRSVTVSWAATSLVNGAPVAGYLVRRYNVLSGAQATIDANCTGLIVGLICKENIVPTGTWQYTVTPAIGNWRGAESAPAVTVVV